MSGRIAPAVRAAIVAGLAVGPAAALAAPVNPGPGQQVPLGSPLTGQCSYRALNDYPPGSGKWSTAWGTWPKGPAEGTPGGVWFTETMFKDPSSGDTQGVVVVSDPLQGTASGAVR